LIVESNPYFVESARCIAGRVHTHVVRAVWRVVAIATQGLKVQAPGRWLRREQELSVDAHGLRIARQVQTAVPVSVSVTWK